MIKQIKKCNIYKIELHNYFDYFVYMELAHLRASGL